TLNSHNIILIINTAKIPKINFTVGGIMKPNKILTLHFGFEKKSFAYLLIMEWPNPGDRILDNLLFEEFSFCAIQMRASGAKSTEIPFRLRNKVYSCSFSID